MKKLIAIAASAPFLILTARAQDDAAAIREKLAKAEDKLKEAMQMRISTIGAVKGMPVKNAPYSGEEVNEANQVLADGTRIHRETRTMVYRDSEGRTRRETPDSIIITDPVASTTYILNPKTMTGQKLTMMQQFVKVQKAPMTVTSSSGPVTSTFEMRMESDGGKPSIIVNGQPLDDQEMQKMMAKMKAEGMTADHMVVTSDSMVTTSGSATYRMGGGGAVAGPMLKKNAGESLGKQTIEGVSADGNRSVSTIKAGSIGNDRDIQITSESWYSTELQAMITSKHSDPRSGEENFRLTNINRNEPAPYLFQLPTGYTINGDKK